VRRWFITRNTWKYYGSNGSDGNVAAVRSNLALAKSICEGGNNEEVLVKTSQELYELRVAK
jgi:hypothetical protein